MNKQTSIGLVSCMLILFAAGSANAMIINLDATDANNEVQQNLSSGIWDVTVIGSSVTGASYDAWNPWGYEAGCDSASGADCSNGWVNTYHIAIPSLPEQSYGDGDRYLTPELALANAVNTSFTLPTAGLVTFAIRDNPWDDNEGGISLDVTMSSGPNDPIPEPATMLLFGTGLAGLVGSRFRRKK